MADETPPIDRTIIKPIQLDDAQGRWLFEPRADITALEAVLINHMFAAIAIRHLHGNNSRWDWREYLTRKHEHYGDTSSGVEFIAWSDLARHFKPVE